MSRAALIASAGMLAFGAWWAYRFQGDALGGAKGSAGGGAAGARGGVQSAGAGAVDLVGGSMLSLSRMRGVNAAMLQGANVQAMLRVIRTGEGTTDANGYRRLVGGGEFDSFADHPRIVRSGTFRNGVKWRSSAAGAYQFLASTWDETARVMGLRDFSPDSQDMGALGRIAARGALDDVIAGRFDAAIKKIAPEWASLPGSPYGQPVMTWDKARAVYAGNGGMVMA